jgi:hypothetical protein
MLKFFFLFSCSHHRTKIRSSDLFAWWHRLARPVTWFDPVWFFLWGYLKAKVYARCPGTIEQLKEAIRQGVAVIPPAVACKAMDNFCEWLQECVINNGRHLSDVIFKRVWKKFTSYVHFINKRIFCVPCFVWFLLTFKMWELFLPHPVFAFLRAT